MRSELHAVDKCLSIRKRVCVQRIVVLEFHTKLEDHPEDARCKGVGSIRARCNPSCKQ